MDIRDFDLRQGAVVEFRLCTGTLIVTASRHLKLFCRGYGYPWLWFLTGSGCWVQAVYRYITMLEYSSIGYIDNSDFLFGSAFQIMNMHRDLSTYMVIRPILIQSYKLHMRATKEHTGIIKNHFVWAFASRIYIHTAKAKPGAAGSDRYLGVLLPTLNP